jgi:hypothetical protein
MIPAFVDGLNLPTGGHRCTLTELEHRFASNEHRRRLFDLLLEVLRQARRCGFLHALLAGSFPTAKELPDDIDVTWFCAPGVDKTTVRDECIEIMEDTSEKGSFQFVPFDRDSGIEEQKQKLDLWASPRFWGVDYKTMQPRGVILLDLTDDDQRLR